MGKKKIKPKLNDSFYAYDTQNVLYPYKSYIQKHDNGKVPVGGSGAQGHCYIRVPSIKRSPKIWKNFYKLFPHIYRRMCSCAEKQNAKPGQIINMYWPSTFDFWDEYRRTVKVLVLDLSGEFTKITKHNRHTCSFLIKEKHINDQNTCKI